MCWEKPGARERDCLTDPVTSPSSPPHPSPPRPCPVRASLCLRVAAGERPARGLPGFAAHSPVSSGRVAAAGRGGGLGHSNGSAVSRRTRVTAAAAAAHLPRRGFVLHSFGLPPLPLSPAPCPASAEGNPAEGRGARLQAPGNFPYRLMGGGDRAEERSWGRGGGRGKECRGVIQEGGA